MNRSFGIELEIANITRETSWMRGSVIRAHVEDLIAAGFLTRIK